MRSALRAVVFIVSSIALLPVGARAQAPAEARTGDAVGFELAWNHVALSVPNIAESIAWYEKMLGFKGTVRPGQPGARQQVADLRRGNITDWRGTACRPSATGRSAAAAAGAGR